MHVLLEGVLIMEMKLLLRKLIFEETYFDLHTLNARISSFQYGRIERKSKPPKTLQESHVNGASKLALSGIYMYNYSVILGISLDH